MNLSIFAERLSDLILDNNLTPETLAKDIDCCRASTYKYLTGQRIPTVDILVRIADYFHCSTDYLVGLEENFHTSTIFKPCPPFKERIPAICEHFNISRYKLHQITKIGNTPLYYWAKGETIPTVENLYKMAKALNCSLDFILGRTEI